MGRRNPPEQCSWCGRRFYPVSSSEPCCSIACYAESSHAARMLRRFQRERVRLEDELDRLHRGVHKLWIRSERLIERLRRLGEKWRKLPAGPERNAVEFWEQKTAKALGTVTERIDARDRLTRSPTYHLIRIEREVEKLKRRLGEEE